jgi:hypothetical protein
MRRTAIFLFPALTFALGCQTAAPSRVSRPPEFLTSPEEPSTIESGWLA